MLRRTVVVLVMVLVLVSTAGIALAKGPTGATIDGPALKQPIVVEGSGEFRSGNDFSEFVEAAGFWHLVFGAENIDSELGEVVEAPPGRDLGVAYTVTWHVARGQVVAELYPFAAGGPMVHVTPGQPLPDFDVDTVGGWFAAEKTLREQLVGYGVPVSATALPLPTETSAEPVFTPATGVPRWVMVLAAMGAGVIAFWALRRRPRRAAP